MFYTIFLRKPVKNSAIETHFLLCVTFVHEILSLALGLGNLFGLVGGMGEGGGGGGQRHI